MSTTSAVDVFILRLTPKHKVDPPINRNFTRFPLQQPRLLLLALLSSLHLSTIKKNPPPRGILYYANSSGIPEDFFLLVPVSIMR